MRSYLSTWQSAEYDKWFVPYHQEVLRAHQSHFCLLAIAADWGFQSDVSDIQTETEQISTIMCIMRVIGIYLRERVRRRLMSAAVFPGVVWRKSLHQRRNTLVTPINSFAGSTTGDPNSPPQYAHLKPNEIGNFFLPAGIPPPALRLRRMLWSFQFAASSWPWSWVADEVASTACKTVNTTQKIRTGQCISLVGSVA